MGKAVSVEVIATKIFEIRGRKVMLDRDLAALYDVLTKVLNQAVKRNRRRFPEDFMFQLTELEKERLVTICDHLKDLKFSYQIPYVFTEQGVAMLSSVLHTERAIKVNIQIMRAFVKLKELLLTHKDLAIKIDALERKYDDHDQNIKAIFEAIKKLLEPPPAKDRIITGFQTEDGVK
ncbi:MAG: ORF6N domain-containing protein [Candidatus Omnitrophica bacterium]|nr:ORF6N domain-containing protein [Candidatus Omnitrophota bacterium]